MRVGFGSRNFPFPLRNVKQGNSEMYVCSDEVSRWGGACCDMFRLLDLASTASSAELPTVLPDGTALLFQPFLHDVV